MIIIADETVEIESRPHVESLFRKMWLSVLSYYLLLLIFTIVAYFFTKEFSWDLTFILYFWMAFAIKGGSKTACKWGVFLMSQNAVIFASACFMLIFYPAAILFENRLINPDNIWICWLGSLLFLIWSVINLKYLVRILKLHQVRFWTKAPIWGYSIIICIFIGFWIVPDIILNSQGYSRNSIETIYAEVIEHLIEIEREDLTRSMDTPKAQALSNAYPEIILAELKSDRRSSSRIISRKDFYAFSFSPKTGTGHDSQGRKIKFVIYEDYVKDIDGDWFKIILHIKKSD